MWELIENNGLCITEKLKVPGGWIVRSNNHSSVHQIFIEDKEHKWELKK